MSDRAHHAKRISQKKFVDEYLPKIQNALNNAKDFATELPDIIDNIGTNLPELLHELGF